MNRTILLWLWLLFSGALLWSYGHGVSLPTVSPTYRSSISEEGTTTENPLDEDVNPTDITENIEDLYDKLLTESRTSLEDLESITDADTESDVDDNEASESIFEERDARETTTNFPTLLNPITSPSSSFSVQLINKTGRNFGSKIRGIGTNSANSVLSTSSNSTSSNGSSISKSNAPLLRARPTSSVISYNPVNYNRIVKRRKIPHVGRNNTTSYSNVVGFEDSTSSSNSNKTFTNSEQPTVIPSQDYSGSTSSSSSSNNNSSVVISSRPLTSLGVRGKRPKPVILSDNPTTTTTPLPTTISDTIKSSDRSELSISPSPPHPFKVRRVKVTSRRPAISLNLADISSPTLQQPSNVVSATPESLELIAPTVSSALSINAISAAAASDNNAAYEQNPSVSVTISNGIYRYRFPDVEVSSRRIFSEEFGVHRDSFGDDDVETTTEYYHSSIESSTGLPIDTLDTLIEGSLNDDESATPLPPKYRDYFPEDTDSNLRPVLKESGSVSDKDERRRGTSEEKLEKNIENGASVTVTVTRTVLQAEEAEKVTSSIAAEEVRQDTRPTSAISQNNQKVNSTNWNTNANKEQKPADNYFDVEENLSSILDATPALPTSIVTSSSFLITNQGGDGQKHLPLVSSEVGPSVTANEPFTFSKSKEQVSIQTSSFGNSSGHVDTTRYGFVDRHGVSGGEEHPHEHEDDEGGHEHHEFDHGHEHDHGTQTHFNHTTSDKDHSELDDGHSAMTPVNPTQPTPIVSSKDFKNNNNEADETSGPPPHQDESDLSKKPQDIHPTTSSYWDNLGYKSMVLVLSNKTTTNGPGLGTASSNMNIKTTGTTPFLTDQELGFSTPEIDTEFPPRVTPHVGEGTTTTTTTTSTTTTTTTSTTTASPGNDAENEISEEEQNKSTPDGKEQGHADGAKVGNDSSISDKSNNGKDAAKEKTSNKINLEGYQPAVPIFVKMILDMPRAMFCSNLPSFKEMIVTVYADQQMKIASNQIIVVTEANCTDINSSAPNSLTSAKIANSTVSNVNPDSVISGKSITFSNKTASHQLANKTERKTRSAEQETGAEFNQTSNSTEISNGKGSKDKNPLLPVYFFINNKNGSFDRELTESFLELWTKNTSSGNMFFPLVRKVDMIAGPLVSEHAPADENSGIIAAITIASIAAACLFLLGILLLVMRHRQAQTKFAKRCTPVTLDDYSLDNISVYNSFRRKQRLRGSKRSYTNAAFDDPNAPSRPVTSTNIASVLTDASGLESEFKAIPNLNPTLDDIPVGAETKNRYANVIPMPDSRVLLTFQDDQPNTDYINANFIRGASGEAKKYIITQGPLDDTIVDFWRMVWEQQIRVILMVTDFAEGGISKCAEYYPRSETIDCSQLHGDFQITLEKRDITENCITSYLVIKDMERSLRRDVIHMWYHSWPEKGVPSSPSTTVDFLIKARKYTKEPSPILVHCSPGTGRSGTVVACDIAMKTYEANHSVDIPKCVMKLRQDRAGCVQTKEQYLHIYEVLNYYSSRISGNQPDSI